MSRWRICPRCSGDGYTSAHLGAITADEWANEWSQDEQDAYLAGEYDRRCDRCSGSGKVNDETEDRWQEDQRESSLLRHESGDWS